MISLGIESTAHTFAVGIVDDRGRILADVRDTYKPVAGKGFVPRELEEHHLHVAKNILSRVLKKFSWKDIDLISFSQGMGIPNALKVGAAVARYLTLRWKKPLIGVNHGVAHIEIGRLLTKVKDPIVVYLSGGNTQIITYLNGRYRILGETEDIPIGNAFDSLARYFGLKMPGGPGIEHLAKKGRKFISLPYIVKGMDVSFSGILTECIKLSKIGEKREDISFSFQEICFSMLTEATERALAHTEKNEVLLVGGVAANKRLQKMMKIMCKDRGAKMYVVPQKYSGDNGVMIAWTGLLAYNFGVRTRIEKSNIRQKWRVDEVDIKWLD